MRIETRFSLADFLKAQDLFDYGMVPQFLARFDKVVLLNDLGTDVLKEILLALVRLAVRALAALLRRRSASTSRSRTWPRR